MTKNIEYSYDAALDELEKMVRRLVVHEDALSDFNQIIGESRKRKTVPIRGIQHMLANYRKEKSEYLPFNEHEKALIQNLIEQWG